MIWPLDLLKPTQDRRMLSHSISKHFVCALLNISYWHVVPIVLITVMLFL